MNSVNQMVDDLKRRIDDGSKASLVQKKEKPNFWKISLKISTPVVLLNLLVIAVGILAVVNYESEVKRKQSPVSTKNIPELIGSNKGIVIDLVSPDKKIEIVNAKRKSLAIIESAIEEVADLQPSTESDKAIMEPVKLAAVPLEKTEKVAEENKVAKASLKPVEPEVKSSKEKVEAIAPAVPIAPIASTALIAKSKPVVKKEKIVEIEPPADGNRIFNKTPLPLTKEELAETIYQRGENLLAEGEIERATSLLEKALEEYPMHQKSRETLLSIYTNEQSWAKAEAVLRSGISENKKNVLWAMWLSQIYLQQERSAEALGVLNDNAVYAKDNGEYFALLAAVRQNAGDYALALDAYQKALQVDNSTSRWWFGMAVVLEFQANWVDARVAYNQALETGQLPEELKVYAEQRLDYVSSQLENPAVSQ